MFGFFKPRCPIDIREKTWIELRMQWLLERLGAERIAEVEVLTPSPAHFPEAYSGSAADVERIFTLVCERMGVRRNSVELKIFAGARPNPQVLNQNSVALGLYESRESDSDDHKIWIAKQQTEDPANLIATAAHELAHCLLLGGNLLQSADLDHEFITDLLPVLLGFGIFLANSVVQESTHWAGPYLSWWSIRKSGYLPPRMFGYALALFAWYRGDDGAWSKYLRGDPRQVFKSGLAYLKRTNDSLCHPQFRTGRAAPSRLCDRLSDQNAGIRLQAVWELRRPDEPPPGDPEWAALLEMFAGRDPILIVEAATAITAVGRLDHRVVAHGLSLLERFDHQPAVVSAAARALATQKDVIDSSSQIRRQLADQIWKLLDHPAQDVVIAGLTAVRQLTPAGDPLTQQRLLRLLRRGLANCDEVLTQSAVQAIRATVSNPHQVIRDFFRDDPDLTCLVEAALEADFNETEQRPVRLPTRNSLPIPLPGWTLGEILSPVPIHTPPV
ncbi:MAG: hypothetical protein JSS02_14805 [Planctomycetes bacterium]|nr:hypothetical protein [Planctomycetota bacterium]